MNKKRTKLPNLVVIAILTTITVIFWIGFGIYSIFQHKPETLVPKEITQSLDPNLDLVTLKRLESKLLLPDSQIGETILTAPTPEATSTPAATLTPSPTPTVSPESSPSGQTNP